MTSFSQPDQHVYHHADGDKSYSKEIALSGINYNLFIKSDLKDDTLDRMIDLGIATLERLKKMEVRQ